VRLSLVGEKQAIPALLAERAQWDREAAAAFAEEDRKAQVEQQKMGALESVHYVGFVNVNRFAGSQLFDEQ